MKSISCKTLIGTLALSAALTVPAFAQGRTGVGIGIGAGANVNAGSTWSGTINSRGSLNSNGPNAADRDLGLDRAEDRANANADLDAKSTRSGTRMGSSTTTTANARAANSNGRGAADRDYGRDRAEDRRNSNAGK
jgi:hypothetical protein